jgi:hypothetical protein
MDAVPVVPSAPAPVEIVTLKVTLKDVKAPKVTRTIQVPATCTLHQLHRAVQDAMGWEDAHLFQFRDAKGAQIRSLKKKLVVDHAPLTYEYDMGDSWEHSIAVVRGRRASSSSPNHYPALVAWTGACPPEDCGGSWGFAELKAALLDSVVPLAEEHEEYRDYDPATSFDPAKVFFRDVWIDEGRTYKRNCPRYVKDGS